MPVTYTSISALKKHKERLKGHQLIVYRILESHGSLTNNEIERYSGLRINSVCGRTNNLLEKGLITRGIARKCGVTGNFCETWRVVEFEELREAVVIGAENQKELFLKNDLNQ